MRWLAPVVIVALVAIRPTPAHALRATEHATLGSPRAPATVGLRRALDERGAASERRADRAQVFVVPPIAVVHGIRRLARIEREPIAGPRLRPVSIDESARGPPPLVVPSHPHR